MLSLCRPAGGVYSVLMCHADQADLALFSPLTPPGGQIVSCASGDHCVCKSLCHDFHWTGGHLLPSL